MKKNREERKRERRDGNLYSRETLLETVLIPRRRVVKQLIVLGSKRLTSKQVYQSRALGTRIASFETTIYKYFPCIQCGVDGT